MIKKAGKFLLIIPIVALAACRSTETKTMQENCATVKVFFTPSTDCEKNVIAAINSAQKIDIAVYSITNPGITDAIIAAHNRGATIRIVTDKQMAKGKGSSVEKIRSAGIPVLTNKKHKIEHNKFAVFDDVHIVSGSYNWTTNASKYNSENCVFFDQQNKEYSHRFEYLWNIYR